MKPYRIIIADDHCLIRQGIKSIISQDGEMEVVAEAGDGRELFTRLADQVPDMVILDISMPRMNGIEAVAEVREHYPSVRILILTMHSNAQYFYHVISAGAHGYLLKDDSDTELLTAIRTVQQDKTYVSPQLVEEVTGEMVSAFRDNKELPIVHLTDREKQVLQLVVKGHTSKQIAEVLCLSPRTIDHHRAKLLKKFKMRNTVDLVKHVVKNSIILPE
jgi:DNA-binding NarL/FixJ family response regulator